MALDAAQLEKYKQRLNNPNPAERLAAMDELGSIVERSPERIDQQVITVVTNAIRDSDTKVRYNAVSLVAVLARQTMPAHLPLKPGTFDLRSYPPLQVALQQVMFDSDAEIRQNALGAYVFAFKLTPDLQQRLVTQFESADKSSRFAIISALTIDGNYSGSVTGTLLRLLDDPEYDFVVAGNLSTSLAPPPAALLPKLAERLVHAQDDAHKQAFAGAIAKYGVQGRPYLGQIEQMRDKETDATTKLNLNAAVEAVRGSAPAITPKPTPTTPVPGTPVPTATPAPSSPAPRVAESPAPTVEQRAPVWPWVVGIAALLVIVAIVLKRRA